MKMTKHKKSYIILILIFIFTTYFLIVVSYLKISHCALVRGGNVEIQLYYPDFLSIRGDKKGLVLNKNKGAHSEKIIEIKLDSHFTVPRIIEGSKVEIGPNYIESHFNDKNGSYKAAYSEFIFSTRNIVRRYMIPFGNRTIEFDYYPDLLTAQEKVETDRLIENISFKEGEKSFKNTHIETCPDKSRFSNLIDIKSWLYWPKAAEDKEIESETNDEQRLNDLKSKNQRMIPLLELPGDKNLFVSKDESLMFYHRKDWVCREVIYGVRIDCYPEERQPEEYGGGLDQRTVMYPEISIEPEKCRALNLEDGWQEFNKGLYYVKDFGGCKILINVGSNEKLIKNESDLDGVIIPVNPT